VATTRGDVNFVVTEYGIAELQGKSIYQRVMELAQIAHPKFREELIDVAKTRHYIFSDQLALPGRLDFYRGLQRPPDPQKRKSVEFRPLLPSDEFAYRNFFYSLQEKTIYFRFFYKMKLFSHAVVQAAMGQCGLPQEHVHDRSCAHRRPPGDHRHRVLCG
jgi:hypothetical protein